MLQRRGNNGFKSESLNQQTNGVEDLNQRGKTKTMRDPFVVSSITWHEVADAVAIDNINLLEDALRSHLKLSDAMLSGNLSKVLMAQRMVTSRSQLDRVLDPDNLSIQLDTLIKAARAVGKTVEISLK